MKDKLKRCNFCDYPAEVWLIEDLSIKPTHRETTYMVHHYCNTFRQHLTTPRYNKKRDAVKAWNTRV